ncbi:regulator of volume decrease after cellular swelling-domain-containing protein [Fimicolochytrium jonesii]|uniref:regulator of volume decrease after cellular swelling-domain-containing protein n=1 Tax=Fimicolochytrium jonesii TaxID=1396493 RepID=UPI0022FF19FB|nr:regulator of volume decrease after cellular swelling-domain-containing protein [Fimicolochytrium jonesii]KAI8816571.1 regulator of volume decrease after cellular swelling-domain-containing protein [Fimicolochytrium jonesii]
MPIHISSTLPELISPTQTWQAYEQQQLQPSCDMVDAVSATQQPALLPRVRHMQQNVTLLFTPALATGVVPGKGELYIAETQIVFFNPSTSICIAIDYPSIGIHAVSRHGDDVTGVNIPHIYAQLDSATVKTHSLPTAVIESQRDANGNVTNPSARAEEEDEEDDEKVEEDSTPEFRLVPDDVTGLDALYQAISSCAALHPDPTEVGDDQDADEEDSNDWYTTPESAQELNDLQQAALDHLSSVFAGPNPFSQQAQEQQQQQQPRESAQEDQFADAEEDMQR